MRHLKTFGTAMVNFSVSQWTEYLWSPISLQLVASITSATADVFSIEQFSFKYKATFCHRLTSLVSYVLRYFLIRF